MSHNFLSPIAFTLSPYSYQMAGEHVGSESHKKAELYLAPWRKSKAAWEAKNLKNKFKIKVLGVFDTVGQSLLFLGFLGNRLDHLGALGVPGFVPKHIVSKSHFW